MVNIIWTYKKKVIELAGIIFFFTVVHIPEDNWRFSWEKYHFSTENSSNTNENKNTHSPFPLTQITPKKSDKDPTLVTSDLENDKAVIALLFIGTQETRTSKTQSILSVHEDNQKTFKLELDDISANMIALKSFLMNEIYDLRQELNQLIKSLNKQEDLTELKTQLQYLTKRKLIFKGRKWKQKKNNRNGAKSK